MISNADAQAETAPAIPLAARARACTACKSRSSYSAARLNREPARPRPSWFEAHRRLRGPARKISPAQPVICGYKTGQRRRDGKRRFQCGWLPQSARIRACYRFRGTGRGAPSTSATDRGDASLKTQLAIRREQNDPWDTPHVNEWALFAVSSRTPTIDPSPIDYVTALVYDRDDSIDRASAIAMLAGGWPL